MKKPQCVSTFWKRFSKRMLMRKVNSLLASRCVDVISRVEDPKQSRFGSSGCAYEANGDCFAMLAMTSAHSITYMSSKLSE